MSKMQDFNFNEEAIDIDEEEDFNRAATKKLMTSREYIDNFYKT